MHLQQNLCIYNAINGIHCCYEIIFGDEILKNSKIMFTNSKIRIQNFVRVFQTISELFYFAYMIIIYLYL